MHNLFVHFSYRVVDDIRCQLSTARVLGEATNSRWVRRILAVPDGSVIEADHDVLPISPMEYLDKGTYEVIT